MSTTNHRFRLARRPVGMPQRTDFTFDSAPVPAATDGQVVVKILYVSLDPAMRGWMNDAKSYIPPVGIGEVMRAGAVGKVVASKHPKYAVGDHVVGYRHTEQALDALEHRIRRARGGLQGLWRRLGERFGPA